MRVRLNTMVALGILLLVLSAVLIVVGGLAAFRKLPGNPVIGLRVAEVRKSQQAWDFAHAIAGPVWALGGLALVFGGVVALSAHGWMWLIPAISTVVAVLAVSVGANMGARAAYLYEEQHGGQGSGSSGSGCGDGGCTCGASGDASGQDAGICADAAPAVDVEALRTAVKSSAIDSTDAR